MAELRVKGTGTIKLFENDNTSSVTIASPASLSADKTITLPDANVTLASGTMLATDGSGASLTALNASELGSGTVPTARLGSGTASSTTILYGDQTYKTEPSSGITDMSQWRLTTAFTGTLSPINANLAEASGQGYARIGSAMTESSGLFTFPSTGFWWIFFGYECYFSGDSRYNYCGINTSTDDSAYHGVARGATGISQSESSTTYAHANCDFLFDVTSTSTHKCSFFADPSDSSVETAGSSTINRTYLTFVRVGDT
jgi:hypothetical protein